MAIWRMPQSIHFWSFHQWQDEDNKTNEWLWPIKSRWTTIIVAKESLICSHPSSPSTRSYNLNTYTRRTYENCRHSEQPWAPRTCLWTSRRNLLRRLTIPGSPEATRSDVQNTICKLSQNRFCKKYFVHCYTKHISDITKSVSDIKFSTYYY